MTRYHRLFSLRLTFSFTLVILLGGVGRNNAVSDDVGLTEQSWNQLGTAATKSKTVAELTKALDQLPRPQSKKLAQATLLFAANIAISNRDPEDYEKCFRFVTSAALLTLASQGKLEKWPADATIDRISIDSLNLLSDLTFGYPDATHPLRIVADDDSSIVSSRQGIHRFYELISYRNGVRHDGFEIRRMLGNPSSTEWNSKPIPKSDAPPEGSFRELHASKIVPCFVAARAALASELIDDATCKHLLQVIVGCMITEPKSRMHDSLAIGAGVLVRAAKEQVSLPDGTVVNKKNLRSLAAGAYFYSGRLEDAKTQYQVAGALDPEASFVSSWGQAICDIGLKTPLGTSSVDTLIQELTERQDEENRRQILKLILLAFQDHAGQLASETSLLKVEAWSKEKDEKKHRLNHKTAVSILLDSGNWEEANFLSLQGLELSLLSGDRKLEVEFLTYIYEVSRGWAFYSLSWERSRGRWAARKDRNPEDFAPAIDDFQQERVKGLGDKFRYGMLTPDEDFATCVEFTTDMTSYTALADWAKHELDNGNPRPWLKLLFLEWYELPYEKRFKKGDFSYMPMNISNLADTETLPEKVKKVISADKDLSKVFQLYRSTVNTLYRLYNKKP